MLKMSTKVSHQKGNKANGTSIIHKSNTSVAVNKGVSRSWSCGLMPCKRSKFSSVKFLKHLGGEVAKGLHVVSMKIRPSPKVSSSSSSSGRSSKPFVTVDDSQRTAAIQDCIEFINSSASLPRSNSVPANPH